MRLPLSRWARDVLGTNDQVFVNLLCRQVDAAIEAARLLLDETVKGVHPEDLDARVREIENRGDAHRNQLITELSSALTTPVDREDLFRLSRSIDDVLDNLRDFADEVVLYQVEPHERLGPPLEAIAEGLESLRSALEDLEGSSADLPASSRDAKHTIEVRAAYHHAVADLLDDELTMDTLRYREVLRRLDVAGLRLEEAVDALSDAALKRA